MPFPPDTTDDELLASAAVLRALPNGVVICDRAGVVRSINPAAAHLLAIDADAFVGRNFSELPGALPIRPEGQQTGVLMLNNRDLRFQWAPIFSNTAQDMQIGMLVSLYDLSPVTGADREFISIVVHDLRHHVSSMLNSLQVVLRILNDPLTDTQRQLLNVARTSSQCQLSLINDLFDISRIDFGTVKLWVEPLNLGQIIRDVVQMHEHHFTEHSITLAIDLQEDLPPLAGDRRSLREIIFKLLDNAWKYTPKGGSVAIRAYREGDSLRVDVQDTGVGIDPDAQRSLFTRGTRKRAVIHQGSATGSGLGLAIAKGLIELHGGRVWFESSAGQGSTFSFTLPL